MSSIDYADCEPLDFYSEVKAKARKPHKCCDTDRVIQPGERYWRIAFKCDGQMSSFAQSEAAYHFARWISGVGSPTGRTACIDFGGMSEYVRDCENDEYTAEWARVCNGEITRTT